MRQTILSFLLVLLPLAVSADAVEIDGVYYNLVTKLLTADVTSNPNYYRGAVTIPKTVTYNDITYNVTGIEDYAFQACVDLTSVTIPSSVTSIGGSAFYYCEKLNEVFISDLTAWCNIAFKDAQSNPLFCAKHLYLNGKEIRNLVVPNSVTTIGSYAFFGCSGLTSVTIPNSVTSIETSAFMNCSGLTSISFPNSVTSIGSRAFYGCSSLTSVTIPNSVTSIEASVFSGCSSLTSVIIGNSVTAIGVYAFNLCSSLTSITIPNSVTTIGNYAFQSCNCLTSFTIPNSVASIGKYVFSNCSGLTSISIPNSVTSLGEYAFKGCSGLTTITIGSGVKKINSNTFANCPELTNVYCYAETVPNTNGTAFNNSYIEHATLHVPESAIENYQATAPWSSFKNFVNVTDNNNYYDLSVVVSNTFGKVAYGTKDVTDGQQTFYVKGNSDAVLTLIPNDGFKVDKVTVNGEDKTADMVDGQLTLSNVSANLIVGVSFGVAGDNATITIGDEGMVTFCPIGDVDFTSVNGVKAYIGSIFNRETGALTMTRAYDVPAGTGLLIKGEPGTYEIPYKQSHSIVSNLLNGVITETNLLAITGGYANYVLGSGTNGTGFYRVPAEGTTLAAGRAYLTIPAETAASRSALRLVFDDEEEATVISDVERQEGETVVYDLQGRRVEQPQRGLYIRSGKKVIIK